MNETIEFLIQFFGWCSIINIGMLIFSALIVVVFTKHMSKIHAILFKLENQDIRRAYFQYLAQFKILIIIFNIVPYFALKLIS